MLMQSSPTVAEALASRISSVTSASRWFISSAYCTVLQLMCSVEWHIFVPYSKNEPLLRENPQGKLILSTARQKSYVIVVVDAAFLQFATLFPCYRI